MRFSDLAGEPQAINPQKCGLLLVIPCHNEYELLVRHLDLLAKQTFHSFNALVVLGTNFDQEKLARHVKARRFPFGVLLSKRTAERGGAGAFYAGQRYALEQGYSYCILSDADCMPTDPGVVEDLYQAALDGADYVSPSEVLADADGVVFELDESNRAAFTSIYHYTLFSSKLMRQFGLIFLPAFGGAEDVEYAERIRAPRTFVKASVTHPLILGDPTYRKFDKFWAYTLNTLFLVRNPKRVLLNLVRVLGSACTIGMFFTPSLRPLGARILSQLASFRYGHAAFQALHMEFSRHLLALDEPTRARLLALRFGTYANDPTWLLPRLFGSFLLSLRKDVLVESSRNDVQVTFLALSARRLYYNMGNGQVLLLADNGPALVHLVRLLFSIPFAVLMSAAVGSVFLAHKFLSAPRTLGYGLDGLEEEKASS